MSGKDRRTFQQSATTGSKLLASVAYNPASLTTYTLASATPTLVDGTNLILPAFMVPASGIVLVEFAALCRSGGGDQVWTIFEGGAELSVAHRISVTESSNAILERRLYSRLVSGLTPGQSKTWAWAWFTSGASTANIYTGGGAATVGSAVMRVWAVA